MKRCGGQNTNQSTTAIPSNDGARVGHQDVQELFKMNRRVLECPVQKKAGGSNSDTRHCFHKEINIRDTHHLCRCCVRITDTRHLRPDTVSMWRQASASRRFDEVDSTLACLLAGSPREQGRGNSKTVQALVGRVHWTVPFRAGLLPNHVGRAG